MTPTARRQKSALQLWRESEAEADLQSSVVQQLESQGYTVMVTSERRHGRGGGHGQSKGIPDLIVTRKRSWRGPGFPKGFWVGIEMKAAKTRVSREQQALADDGRAFVCRTPEEVFAAIAEAERNMGRDG